MCVSAEWPTAELAWESSYSGPQAGRGVGRATLWTRAAALIELARRNENSAKLSLSAAPAVTLPLQSPPA